MSQIKTKRVLWTIAALIALSLLAGMLLHKHSEPQIIGKFSRADVSEISDLVLNSNGELCKKYMKDSLKQRDVKALLRGFRYYSSTHVLTITSMAGGAALATLECGTNMIPTPFFLIKEGKHWRFD